MAETSYAKCGDLSLAYQVFGDGPVELTADVLFDPRPSQWHADPTADRHVEAHDYTQGQQDLTAPTEE